MADIIGNPPLFFVVSLVLMSIGAWLGVWLLKRSRPLDNEARADFGVVQSATLTLLALVIGFNLSMAVNRYDERKGYEEEEANAIGSALLRAELLPADSAANVRALLIKYLDQRIRYYQLSKRDEVIAANRASNRMQGQLWEAVRAVAATRVDSMTALAVSSINEVINRQGYTQAEWMNRIPPAAWSLMLLIGFLANVLVGYASRSEASRRHFLLVMPVVVSLSFMLIADIDSPRGGIIRVTPQNLQIVAQSLSEP